MQARPLPVIMISSVTQASSAAAVEAMAEGCGEDGPKPAGPYSVGEFRNTLSEKIRAAALARLPQRRAAAAPVRKQPAVPAAETVFDGSPLIVVGASTGGTEAVERILVQLPAGMPPIAVVQHIPAGFSRAFADRLARLCQIRVREAVHGDWLETGTALIAPGNFHMRVIKMAGKLRVAIEDGPPVCYQRPSVDVLFDSAADLRLAGMIGVLLTGMGADGARGMVALRAAGAHTIAQDKASSVVFGMPREAIRVGAASAFGPRADWRGLDRPFPFTAAEAVLGFPPQIRPILTDES